MQQEVAEVLETNAQSKKCNPVEAGLYKFKAGKLDSGILYSVGISLRNCQRSQPPTMPIGFDFEMEKKIKQREAKRVLEDKHFKFMWSLALIASC